MLRGSAACSRSASSFAGARAENVFDFTLGNPDVEPPEAVIAALRRVVAENRRAAMLMPNAGFPRSARPSPTPGGAQRSALYRRKHHHDGGRRRAINTVLKSILDPATKSLS